MIPRYTSIDFSAIWSDLNKYETWLEIELLACKSMEPEIVPEGTSDRIRNKHIIIDPKEIENIEKTTKHDVIAFLTYIENIVGEDAKWLHYGMTSSDLLDTGFAETLSTACVMLMERLDNFIAALEKQVMNHKDTVMIGRTHGRHAELTTFGLAMASHMMEMKRNKYRLELAEKEIAVGKLSGAVGTYAHTSPEIEEEVMEQISLKPEIVSTQIIPRDRYAFLFSVLALIASGIERLATNIRDWQHDEIAEVMEGFAPGQKGSSAMPHKRNPILSENLCGLARMMRSYMIPAYENIPLWHERDISHSSVERIIAPDATSLLAFMLERATDLVNNLYIDPNKMRANIVKSNTHFSEAILLTLIRNGVPRQKAYELIQQQIKTGDISMYELSLIEGISPDKAQIICNQLCECFDVSKCLKHVNYIITKALDA